MLLIEIDQELIQGATLEVWYAITATNYSEIDESINDKLKLEVKIIKKKGPIGIGEGIATVDGKLAAKGEFTFAVV